jgi:hypothetical protein
MVVIKDAKSVFKSQGLVQKGASLCSGRHMKDCWFFASSMTCTYQGVLLGLGRSSGLLGRGSTPQTHDLSASSEHAALSRNGAL